MNPALNLFGLLPAQHRKKQYPDTVFHCRPLISPSHLISASSAYAAHCGSVVSFCICSSTLFLQGHLETLRKKTEEQYKWPVAVEKLGLFHYLSANWDLWLQAKVI